MSVSISSLGIRVDGWADLVEDAGSKAGEAMSAASAQMKARGMPNVVINQAVASPGSLSAKQRPYILAQMPNGASIAVYVSSFGKDLYASWDMYVRPLINWRNLAIMLIIAVVIVGPCALVGALGSLSNVAANTNRSLGAGASSLVASSISSIAGILGGVVVVFFFVVGAAAFVGRILKGSALALFFKELDSFDADDIGAMSLAVHKSILHALDSVGIRVQSLRLKEQFRAGSRERVI